jgi:hypothetical protein
MLRVLNRGYNDVMNKVWDYNNRGVCIFQVLLFDRPKC